MLLKNEDMQKIVDRVIGILGKNINIMNKDGIIIASGNPDRIGSYHEASKISAEERKSITITKDNRYLFKGCKPGVNIPIYHKNQVIGVVGITGDSALVEGYAHIVKELVELLIQEKEIEILDLYQKNAINSFIKELLNNTSLDNTDILTWRADYIDFNISTKRSVMVTDITDFNSIIAKLSNIGLNSEIEIQKLKHNIVHTINTYLDNKNDYVIALDNDSFVILKSKNKDNNNFLISLNNIIKNKFNLTFHFAVGEECTSLMDYSKSFRTANKLMTLGKKLHPNNLIFNIDQYKLYLFYDSIPEQSKKDFLSYYPQIFNVKLTDNMINILKTVKIYFENKMNIKETSEKMFIHRNTIVYRFKKLHEVYNIDVSDSYQCMLLYNCIILSELSGIM